MVSPWYGGEMEKLWEPEILSRYEIKGLGQVFTVQPGRYLNRGKPEIVGDEIVVDGIVWRIRSVERYALADDNPIKPHEMIGLLVERVPT